MSRLNYKKISPEGFMAMGNVLQLAAQSGIETGLLHMVYLRVSQINECPYCVDLHWRDAVKVGEDTRKLNALSIWHDAPFFSEKERAALQWAESVTYMDDQINMEDSYDLVCEYFNEKQVVDLTFAIAQMNAFNRVGIAFHAVPAV